MNDKKNEVRGEADFVRLEAAKHGEKSRLRKECSCVSREREQFLPLLLLHLLLAAQILALARNKYMFPSCPFRTLLHLLFTLFLKETTSGLSLCLRLTASRQRMPISHKILGYVLKLQTALSFIPCEKKCDQRDERERQEKRDAVWSKKGSSSRLILSLSFSGKFISLTNRSEK